MFLKSKYWCQRKEELETSIRRYTFEIRTCEIKDHRIDKDTPLYVSLFIVVCFASSSFEIESMASEIYIETIAFLSDYSTKVFAACQQRETGRISDSI